MRADASARIGGGHMMRCLTLADALSAKGWTPAFACNGAAMSAVPQLSGQEIFCVADDRLDAASLARRWPQGCDMLVVDHYGLDANFESSCREWAKKIVVLDDLADRRHDCDVLIDATYQRDAASYATLVSPATTMLLGPAFALLRPEFAAMRVASIAQRADRTDTERVLVSLGLTDLNGITEQIVNALLSLPGHFLIDVVTRDSSQSWKPLANLAAREPRLVLHDNPPNMSSLMATADFAIGAGGTTSWERCALGLPTVLLVLAENQSLIAENLGKAGAAIVVASPLDANEASFRNAVDELARNLDLRLSMSAAAAAIVDGAGAERISNALMHEPDVPNTREIFLRRATLQDSLTIWTWRNDVESRANSKQTRPVSWIEHGQWFNRIEHDQNKFIFIAFVAGDGCGMVRFDRTGGTKLLVSVIVAPHWRGTGFGTALLEQACAMMAQSMPGSEIRADIKTSNAASRRAFEACGFVRADSKNGMLSYVLNTALHDYMASVAKM